MQNAFAQEQTKHTSFSTVQNFTLKCILKNLAYCFNHDILYVRHFIQPPHMELIYLHEYRICPELIWALTSSLSTSTDKALTRINFQLKITLEPGGSYHMESTPYKYRFSNAIFFPFQTPILISELRI